MLRLPRQRPIRRRENTIALINIVFLMLVFYLAAGTLAPPLDREVALVSTTQAERAAPPDALFVTREGTLRAGGVPVDAQGYVRGLVAEGGGRGSPEIRLAADRALPATRLIEIVGTLRQAGAGPIRIVTERSAP